MIAATLQPGQVVEGKYRVDYLLGEGGMAAVWAGTNERTGKRVALKVILQALAATPVAKELLHSEGLAASRVNHPNVVTIFDVIEHQGMACIVMELLDGEPLGRYIIRNGCLSVQEATFLLLPAMRGVAAAHAQGVVHRDLKPQNIFLCVGPDGRVVTTKVLDFGISVIVERVVDPSTARPGVPMGTPGYMSPEHVSGVPVIDARADVYGFGLLLYESLTGQMAFPGDPNPELFDRILTQPPPSVALLRPDMPPGLVRIIEKAVAKRPDDRFANLDAMVSALEEEVMPVGLSQRSLTPLAGMPLFPMGDPLAGQLDPVVQAVPQKEASERHQGPAGSAVQAVRQNEASRSHQGLVGRAMQVVPQKRPSWLHQRTKVLFGFSLKQERGGRASSRGGFLREDVFPPSADFDTEIVNLRPRLFRVRDFRLSLARRTWRALLGVGLGVVLVVVAWTAMRDFEAKPLAAPPPTEGATEPVTESAVPPIAPTVVPIPSVAPEPAPAADLPLPSPSEPETLAADEPGRPASRTRGGAPREVSRESSPHRSAVRSASWRGEPVSAQKAGTSAKSAPPRAGSLSADDF